MFVMVPDIGLEKLLASKVLLAQLWPGASDEVVMLVHILRMAPTLADALAVGLLAVMTPFGTKPTADIALVYKTTVVSATAHRASGRPVRGPQARAKEVERLEIVDVAVAGRARARMTG